MFFRFTSDKRGSVAIIFAFFIGAMTFAVAMVIEISRIFLIRQEITRVVDGAALASVSKNAIDSSLSDADQVTKSKSIATGWVSRILPPEVSMDVLNVNVFRSGSSLQVNIDWTASVSSFFSSLFGSRLALSGASSSSVSAAYVDILVLVDNSQSMGLGADLTTQNKMRSDSRVNYCALACHGNPGDVDTVSAAHSAGYQLRIDIVKKALASVIDDVSTAASETRATIRVGIYSINTKFSVVKDLTSDYSGLKTAASSLDIAHWGAGSSLKYGLDQVKSKMVSPGDGSSPSSPLTFVMLITDGMINSVDNTSSGAWNFASTSYPSATGKKCWLQSPPSDSGPYYSPSGSPFSMPCVPDPWTSKHSGNGQMELNAIDASWCSPIKNQGARFLTLYTQYVLSPDASNDPNNWYTNDWRLPLIKNTIQPILSSRMSSCASTSADAYSASDVSGIDSGIASMFGSALAGAARLTR